MPLSMLPRYQSPYGASGRSSKPSGQCSSPGMRNPPPRRSMVARSFSGSTSGTRGAHRLNASDSSSTVASRMACTGCALWQASTRRTRRACPRGSDRHGRRVRRVGSGLRVQCDRSWFLSSFAEDPAGGAALVTGQLSLSPGCFCLLAEQRLAVPDGAGATRRASSGWVVGGNKRSADTRHPRRRRPQDG